MEIGLIKIPGGFSPADERAQEYFNKKKLGQYFLANIKEPRNPKFHRKFFALLNYAFDCWEPGEIDSKHGKPEKSFEQFRNDVVILAGFFDVAIRLDGSTRITAKSISFAKMNEREFEELYSKVIDVLLRNVLKGMTREEVDEYTDKVLGFA